MYPKELKTLGDHVRKVRLDRKLRQRDVAQTLGVSVDAVNNWEVNRSQPHLAVLPRVLAFQGYAPPGFDAKPDEFSKRVRLYRHLHGISQRGLAALLGIDPTTVAGWENGDHAPSQELQSKFTEFDAATSSTK